MKVGFLYNNSIVFLNIIEFHLFPKQIPADCHEFRIALKKKKAREWSVYITLSKNLRLCRVGRAEAATPF